MTTAENKKILSSFVQDVLDGKNLDAADNYLSTNFLHHDRAPGEETKHQTGLAGTKTFLNDVVFPAFSDFATTFEDVIAEGDLVAARWRQTSRNAGPWLGRAATGRTSEIAGISLVRIRDGQIIEEWEARDALSLLSQLGVPVPKPKLPGTTLAPTPPATPQDAAPFLTNGPLGTVVRTAQTDLLKRLTARIFMDAWNKGNLSVLGTLLAPGYVLHDPTGLLAGNRNGSAQLITAFRTGLPNLNVSVDLSLAEGDRVVNYWTVKGTQTGTLFGVAPKGVNVSVTGISIFRGLLGLGLIQEEWTLWDQMSLFQQLGALSI
jgi:predicted ester cyclase